MVTPARGTAKSGNIAQSPASTTGAPTTATPVPDGAYLGCYNEENRTWPTSGNDPGKVTHLRDINSPAK